MEGQVLNTDKNHNSTSHDHVCHLGPSGAPILLHVGLVSLGQTSRRLPCLSMIIGSFFGIPTNILQCKFWFTCQRTPLRAVGKSSATCSRRRSQKELLRPVVGLVWCASSGAFVSRSGSVARSAVTFARRGRIASEIACLSTCDGADWHASLLRNIDVPWSDVDVLRQAAEGWCFELWRGGVVCRLQWCG